MSSLASRRWDPTRWDSEDSCESPFSPVPPTGHRPLDISGQGYNNWIFMSTHYWDEDPQGLWTLGLENKGYYYNTGEGVGCELGAAGPALVDPQPQRVLGVFLERP